MKIPEIFVSKILNCNCHFIVIIIMIKHVSLLADDYIQYLLNMPLSFYSFLLFFSDMFSDW